jgi:hypothetical protein
LHTGIGRHFKKQITQGKKMINLTMRLIAAGALLSLAAGAATADSHEGKMETPRIIPVETWTCDFRDGKNMNDLKAFTNDFNAWVDGLENQDYFAALLVPHYFGEKMFDVGWLGAWSDGNAMGTGLDLWQAEGGELAANLFSIIDCGSHTQFGSMRMREAPEDDGPDDNQFVLTFTNCSVKEGKNFEEVMGAMKTWADYQDEHGFNASEWMMFPIHGESNNDYDFKVVTGFDNHAARGADFEKMGNGGHWRRNSEIFDGLLDCDISRVYDGFTIRNMGGGDS